MQYRFSPRSVKMPYSMIYEQAILPYFTNAVKPVAAEIKKALLAGLND